MSAADINSVEYKKQFLHEATRLAIELVEKGWGGPFGAVIVKDGKIIGRGQNRVLLTGIPVFHAEVTAIMDATAKLNSKALLGSDVYEGTLKMIPAPGRLARPRSRAGGDAQGLRALRERSAVSDVHERDLLGPDRQGLFRHPARGHEQDRLRRPVPVRRLQAPVYRTHRDRMPSRFRTRICIEGVRGVGQQKG